MKIIEGNIMIYIYLEGHNFRYEIYELVKVFSFDEEIIFVDNIDDYKEGILIKNRVYDSNGQVGTITQIYENDKLVYESIRHSIEDIKIDRGDYDKKLRVCIKQGIYEGLTKIAGVEAPWGILTGIRPVKIVHNLIDDEVDDDSILNILIEEYKLYQEKAELILNIGKKQRKYLYPLDENRFSLYVAIPFCPTRCIYCSFPSCNINRYGHLVDKYTDHLIYEIGKIAELMDTKTISTVYIGGGTPTAISSDNLERIIRSIYSNFGRNNIKEITVEAGRPDTMDYEMLEMLYANGIERISINPQTMNDKTLKIIGRKHTSQDIIDVYFQAKEIGFDIINMDLIIGLPSEGVGEVRETLAKLEELDPENLTVHTLSVKRGSKFRETMEKYQIESQEVIEKMLDETRMFAKKMNLEPYYLYRQKQIMGNFENIGYSKLGKECIYNIIMMEEKETVMAAGMGAVSKIFFPKENRIERVPNVKSIEEYLGRIDEMIERKAKVLTL